MTELTLGKIYFWRKNLRTSVFCRLKDFFNKRQGHGFLFPGLMRLIAFVCGALQPKGPIQIELENMDLCLNGQDSVMTPEILVQRTHEPDETALLKKQLKPGMTFIDLGANIGYFTVIAAQCVGAEGKVYAFEPDPTNHAYLNKNISLNRLQNIETVSKVVLNISGPAILYLDEGNFGGHTCAKENIQTRVANQLQVNAVTLDDFAAEKNIRVDFLKMDIQGSEGLALEKAVETIRRFPVKIMMEFWPAGLRRMGTDPAELLASLSRTFSFEIVGASQEKRSVSEILKLAEVNYLNLFLEKF